MSDPSPGPWAAWVCDECNDERGADELAYCAGCMTRARGAAMLLSKRDAMVRDAALEEAAETCLSRGEEGDLYFAEAIRAMKGAP
jgi:hypothetical protein